jgi:hypothetical protein
MARYESIGVSPTLLDSVATWGESMWPNGNWEQWMIEGSAQTVGLDPGWNVISSDIAPKNDDLKTVFEDVSVSVVKDEDGDTYVPSDDENQIGSWDSEEGYKVYTESSQSLTLVGSSVDATTTIPLQEGWNLVPYLPDDSQPIEDALSSISGELTIVKNEEGETYVPAYGINEIGRLEPKEGYQVYVTDPVDLVYSTSKTTSSASALDD